jgi:hypothetical protein
MDDVSLEVIEEPALAVSTPLDEYYVGEPIPWNVTALSSRGQIKVALLAGNRLVAEQTRQARSGLQHGTFETRELRPGVYTLRATLRAPQEGAESAQQQVIVAPNPFAW